MSVNNLKLRNDGTEKSKTDSTSIPSVLTEPVVVSFSRTYRALADGLSAGDAADRLSSLLTEVAASLREAGAFIGHIKALVSWPEGGNLGISVVRDRADRKELRFDPQSPISTFKTAVTAIVYGCSKDELNRLMKLALALGLPKNLYGEVTEKRPSSIISMHSILDSRSAVSRPN